jgi:hypothetical protein
MPKVPLIEQRNASPERTCTLNAIHTSASVRIVGAVSAVCASLMVLGATVGGMQAGSGGSNGAQVLALNSVVVTATKLN